MFKAGASDHFRSTCVWALVLATLGLGISGCVEKHELDPGWDAGSDADTEGDCLGSGAPCEVGADCCSLNCSEATDGVRRCQEPGPCLSEGEECAEDRDCCTRRCQGGRCLTLTGCDVAGEACEEDGDCCSGLCADNGNGERRCRDLEGCRVTGELCRRDSDCCNDSAFDGPGVCQLFTEGIGRCQNPVGCAPAGELCGPEHHDCCPCGVPSRSPGCPNEGGEAFCRETAAGVSRCFSRDCVVEGGSCEEDAECCGGTCDDETCAAGFECLPDLSPCAFSGECCCHTCAPDTGGERVCCPG